MHHIIDMDRDSRKLFWLITCGEYRAWVSATLILGGAACRLGDPGEVHDALGVLEVDRVVPIVVRVLVSW